MNAPDLTGGPGRTLAPDTTPTAEALLLAHYRQLEPWQKVRIMCDLGATMEATARRGIRERYPDADEREVRLRLAALRLGGELTRRAFGWDPAAEGW